MIPEQEANGICPQPVESISVYFFKIYFNIVML